MEIILGSMLALSAALGWLAYDRLRPEARRAFRRAQRKPIASVRNGEVVKILGRAEAGDTSELRSPVGGRRCVFSETVVSFVLEELRDPKHADPGVLVRERQPRELYVVDETGRALVELGTARVVLSREDRRQTEITSDVSPSLRQYLEQHGFERATFEGRTLRCEERVVEPGDPICVVGRARWERDPQPGSHAMAGYREVPQRLVLGPLVKGASIILTDDPEAL